MMSLPFLFDRSQAWKKLFSRSPENIWPLCLVAIFGFALFYCVSDVSHFAHMPYRGTSSMNSLGTFLTYGDSFNLAKMGEWFILGNNWGIYLGILPLVFLFSSRTYHCQPMQQAFWTGMLALLALSFGGAFAAVTYFFPGMAFFRHVGITYDLLKPFLLILGGFGWEYFWGQRSKIRGLFFVAAIVVFAFILDGIGLTNTFFRTQGSYKILLTHLSFGSPSFRLTLYAMVFLALAILFWQRRITHSQAIVTLLLCLLVDICSFQYHAYLSSDYFKHPAQAPYLSVVKVNRLPYQSQRLGEPVDPRQKLAWELQHSEFSPGGAQYTAAFSQIQFEPCTSSFRQDLVPKNLDAFAMLKALSPENTQVLLGCAEPKLRLVASVVAKEGNDQLVEAVLKTDARQSVVVDGGAVHGGDSLFIKRLSQPSPQVTTYTNNQLQAHVDVTAEPGAWLVYADSYHPGWKATVDGKSVMVYRANLDFKAVYVPSGQHKVRFVFFDGLRSICSYLVAIIGFLAGLAMLLVCVFLCVDSRIYPTKGKIL